MAINVLVERIVPIDHGLDFASKDQRARSLESNGIWCNSTVEWESQNNSSENQACDIIQQRRAQQHNLRLRLS